MNDRRKRHIDKVIIKLTDVLDDIELVSEAERESYNNFTENQKYTEKGIKINKDITTLEELCDYLINYISELKEI